MPSPAGSAASTEPLPTPPLSAEQAITLARRWIVGSWLLNAVLFGLVIVATVWGYVSGLGLAPGFAVGVLYFVVLVAGVQSRQLVLAAVPLIAAGDFVEAEQQLGQSLRSFSLLRSTKLIGLQQLATLRHAESKWADAARICRELSNRRGGTGRPGSGFDVQNRLMLAESLVELGDVHGAGVELLGLASLQLDLRETLLLTLVRLDVQSRMGHWEAMMADPQATMNLIELMPTVPAARAYALMALAADRVKAAGWRALFARRATLLMDANDIVANRPIVREALTAFAPAPAVG